MRKRKSRKSLERTRVHTAVSEQSSEPPVLASSFGGGPRSLPPMTKKGRSLSPHPSTPPLNLLDVGVS